MDEFQKWLCAFAVILAIAALVEVLLVYRTIRMRSLAERLGWKYTAGDNHVWKLIFRRKTYPHDFRLQSVLMKALWGTMNIIEGDCGGMRTVVLDSLLHLGVKADRYSTFIAVKTDVDPFLIKEDREIVVHAYGWFTLHRSRFSPLTWSLSIERIEAHLLAIEDWKRFTANPHPQS